MATSLPMQPGLRCFIVLPPQDAAPQLNDRIPRTVLVIRRTLTFQPDVAVLIECTANSVERADLEMELNKGLVVEYKKWDAERESGEGEGPGER